MAGITKVLKPIQKYTCGTYVPLHVAVEKNDKKKELAV